MIASLPFLLVTLFLLQSLPHGLAKEQFIIDVCAKTTIPDQCKSVLMSDLWSLQAASIQSLSLISFDIGIKHTSQAYKTAINLSKQYEGKAQYYALTECAQMYEDMDAKLSSAKAEVKRSKFGEANDLVLSIETEPAGCDSEFVTRNMEDLLLKINHDLTKIFVVCASLTNLLNGK